MIRGERVRLRRIERNDLPRFVEWLNEPAVREHLALVYPLSLPEEQLNLNRIHLRVYEDNAGGIACYEKLGFRHEGRLRQDRYQGGRYLDTLIMGLLRDELR